MTRQCKFKECEKSTHSPRASFCSEHRSKSKREAQIERELAVTRGELAAARKTVRKLKTQVAIRDCETVRYARMACELSSIDLDEIAKDAFVRSLEIQLTEDESRGQIKANKRWMLESKQQQWISSCLLKKSFELADWALVEVIGAGFGVWGSRFRVRGSRPVLDRETFSTPHVRAIGGGSLAAGVAR